MKAPAPIHQSMLAKINISTGPAGRNNLGQGQIPPENLWGIPPSEDVTKHSTPVGGTMEKPGIKRKAAPVCQIPRIQTHFKKG